MWCNICTPSEEASCPGEKRGDNASPDTRIRWPNLHPGGIRDRRWWNRCLILVSWLGEEREVHSTPTYGGQIPAVSHQNVSLECSWYSAFSQSCHLWEIQIKTQIGKLTAANLLLNSVTEMNYLFLPYILELDNLPQHHKDLFDRLLIAQCRKETATSQMRFSLF